MSMRIVTQPEGSNICGHCCVSMVTGVDVEEIIKAIGHRRGTRTKELVKVLRSYERECDDKLTRFSNYSGLPGLAIAKITYDWRKNNGHWVVLFYPLIVCPGGYIHHWTNYLGRSPFGRLTSFLSLTAPTGKEGEK